MTDCDIEGDSFCHLLGDLRREALTGAQETLGEKLGFLTSMVRKWEQGASAITVETLKQICRMYNVTSDFLLGPSDDDPLFAKKRRELLSEKSRETLRQFEAFLIYLERRNAQK